MRMATLCVYIRLQKPVVAADKAMLSLVPMLPVKGVLGVAKPRKKGAGKMNALK